ALVAWLAWSLATGHADQLGSLAGAARGEYLAWAALITFVAWVALPVVVFPLDENLDPDQLATLPIPRPRLVAGLVAAGLISVPAIALVALVGVTVAHRPAAVLVSLPAAVVYVVMAVAGSQGFTTVMSAVFHTRRGRDLAVFLIMGIGLSSFAGYQTIRSAIDAAGLEAAATANSLDAWWWALAPAAPARAISAAWEGEWLLAALALVVATAWTGLLVLGWERVLRWMLVTPRQESAPSSERRKTGFASGRWEVPFVVARKELRFYLRDPRQRLVWTGT